MTRLLKWLPRGNTLDDASWHKRHRLLQWVLLAHVPVLFAAGMAYGARLVPLLAIGLAPILVLLAAGHYTRHRRAAATFITAGLVWCSGVLVVVTGGTIEAHFHFFILVGFIALYQDWVPFLWNVLFTTLSHGIGSAFYPTLIFNHPAAQQNPWLWAGLHGLGVLLACIGVVLFWRITEDEQQAKEKLGQELVLADAELGRRQFASEMLVNLARRNQSMLYRQLDLINQLEEKERDPDALADLFKLDHLATRVRRNAESLLVLAGEQTPRVWSAPVSLRDVVRAAIAETEDLDRVEFAVDERLAVSGHSVADLTHLVAELTENAVRFSPPDSSVVIRSRPNRVEVGGTVLTIEDLGVGMPDDQLGEANDLLANPRDVDLSVSQRLGFHVVARLAARHGIEVSLAATPGSGLTAVVVLPQALFVTEPEPSAAPPLPVRRPGEARSLANGSRLHGTERVAGTQDQGPPTLGGIAAAAERAGVGTAWTAPQPQAANPAPAPPPAPAATTRPAFAPTPAPVGAVQGTDGGALSGESLFGGPAGDWSGWWDRDRGTAGNGGPVNGGAAGPVNGGAGGQANGVAGGHGGGAVSGRAGGSRVDGQADGASHGPAAGSLNGHAARTEASARPAPRPGGGAQSRVPSPRPSAAPTGQKGESDAGGKPLAGPTRGGLKRRVPQASLAPELRAERSDAPTAAPAMPSPDAAHALSRYQASRQAAHAAARAEEGDGRVNR